MKGGERVGMFKRSRGRRKKGMQNWFRKGKGGSGRG